MDTVRTGEATGGLPTEIEFTKQVLTLRDEYGSQDLRDPSQLRMFANRLRSTISVNHELQERADKTGETHKDWIVGLNSLLYGTLDQIPFQRLGEGERDEYICLLALKHDQWCSGLRMGSYDFLKASVVIIPPNDGGRTERLYDTLVSTITNSEKRLTVEQEEELYEDEKDMFKLHLNVPKEQRIATLKTLMQAYKDKKYLHFSNGK